MRAYTTHTEHSTWVSIPVCGDAHTEQSFIGDFIRTCCSRLQYIHMRGVRCLPTLVTGHGQIVAAQLYRACCFVVVGRRLTIEC